MDKWFQIQMKAGTPKKAEVLIYDRIGKDYWGDGLSVEAKKFREELKALEAKGVEEVTVRINSPGGSVFEGMAIYNILKDSRMAIRVKIDGVAASMASVVAMTGNPVIMPENALMMIHDPSAAAAGTAEDMEKVAEILRKVKGQIIGVYAEKSGMKEEELSEMMSEETWFTAQEAKEAGLADEVVAPVQIAADADFKKSLKDFRNVPESFMAELSAKHKQRKKGDQTMTITLEKIKADFPEIAEALRKEGVDSVNLDQVKADAKKEGAEGERARIQAVQAQAMPGHEKMIAELMFDGQTTGPEAAVKVLAAEKMVRANAHQDFQDDAPDALPDVNTDGQDGGGSRSGKDPKDLVEAKALWAKDAKLQAEWDGDEEAYLAYMKADLGGQVKIKGK